MHEIVWAWWSWFSGSDALHRFFIVALNKNHAIACNTIFVPSNKVTFFKYDFAYV